MVAHLKYVCYDMYIFVKMKAVVFSVRDLQNIKKVITSFKEQIHWSFLISTWDISVFKL